MNPALIAVLDTLAAIGAVACLFSSYAIPVPKEDGPLAKRLVASAGAFALTSGILSTALVAYGYGLIA